MSWFTDKYGKDAHPILPIEVALEIFDKFGEDVLKETISDIQDGKIRLETFLKYWKQ